MTISIEFMHDSQTIYYLMHAMWCGHHIAGEWLHKQFTSTETTLPLGDNYRKNTGKEPCDIWNAIGLLKASRYVWMLCILLADIFRWITYNHRSHPKYFGWKVLVLVLKQTACDFIVHWKPTGCFPHGMVWCTFSVILGAHFTNKD